MGHPAREGGLLSVRVYGRIFVDISSTYTHDILQRMIIVLSLVLVYNPTKLTTADSNVILIRQ